MKTYILLTEKDWHDDLFLKLQNESSAIWYRIKEKSDFDLNKLEKINPEIIFIPHWSHKIPSEIYEKYLCIVFHMTDLPFGRGGSPLQNLIVLGCDETVITAFKVEKGLDTGDIYLKRKVSLIGTAEEIFIRSSAIIYTMIKEIVENSTLPVKQEGKIVTFSRRKPEDSNISNLKTVQSIYDYIRMLDCDGYPKAFIDTDEFRFEFSRASLKSDNSIVADVRIIKK